VETCDVAHKAEEIPVIQKAHNFCMVMGCIDIGFAIIGKAMGFMYELETIARGLMGRVHQPFYLRVIQFRGIAVPNIARAITHY